MEITNNTPPREITNNSSPYFSIRDFFKSLIDHKGKNKPDEVRNYLLVVATLIATVTFQAGVNPPGGVWQENSNYHKAGQSIYASNVKAFYVFLIFNTLALSLSICLIIYLTWGFPFFLEVFFATVSMLMTYGASIFAITPRETIPSVHFRYILFIAAVPIIVRLVIQTGKYALWKWSGGKCKFYLA